MITTQPPLSGYAIDGIFSTRQQLLEKAADVDEAQHGAFRFGWAWRPTETRMFDVSITVAVEPSSKRPEYIEANVIGRFRQMNDNPSIPIEEFAALQSVAILLPYARQFLANLTMNSIYGVFNLPTLNVVTLMKGFDVGPSVGRTEVAASAQQTRLLTRSKKPRVRPKHKRVLR